MRDLRITKESDSRYIVWSDELAVTSFNTRKAAVKWVKANA